MTKDKLELMEKWLTVATLMGLTLENIYDDWDDDRYFFGLFEEHERHLARLADPNDTMKIVLQTVEMGVTTTDVDNYISYRDDMDRKKEAEEQAARIFNNPALTKLRNDNGFVLEDSATKRYKKHTYFSFKDDKGNQFNGRIFRKNWGTYRVWLTWKDAKNKNAKWMYDAPNGSVPVPAAFPSEWKTWGYTSEIPHMAHVIAYNVINRKMPKVTKFKYPK